MKRDIEFRVWSGKEMLSWVCIMQTAFNHINVIDGYKEIQKDFESKSEIGQAIESMLHTGRHIKVGLLYSLFTNCDVVFMQFTGLKDSNGTDIYEGDILKGTFSKEYKNFNSGIVVWSKVRCAFVIKIDVGGHYNYEDLTSCNLDGTINAATMTDYNMEIVGNIYENSELLKIK